MYIALDTNIFINIFNGQSEADICYEAIAKALKSGHHCMVSASAITDIYYILNKKIGSTDAHAAISALLDFTRIFDVNEKDVKAALSSEMKDFEDAVFVKAARRAGAELILTYNLKDFAKSDITTMTPNEFIRS